MEKMRLVEPQTLSAVRMNLYRGVHLPGAQRILVIPLAFQSVLNAIALYLFSRACLEYFRPGKIKIGIISDVLNALLFEFAPNRFWHFFVHNAAIGNRCFATRQRREHAPETDSERPTV